MSTALLQYNFLVSPTLHWAKWPLLLHSRNHCWGSEDIMANSEDKSQLWYSLTGEVWSTSLPLFFFSPIKRQVVQESLGIISLRYDQLCSMTSRNEWWHCPQKGLPALFFKKEMPALLWLFSSWSWHGICLRISMDGNCAKARLPSEKEQDDGKGCLSRWAVLPLGQYW